MAIFEWLVDGSWDRDELTDQVDASRVTIARILRELEAREWITRSGQKYTVTPLGEWVYDEFARLVDEMEAEHRVREAIDRITTNLRLYDFCTLSRVLRKSRPSRSGAIEMRPLFSNAAETYPELGKNRVLHTEDGCSKQLLFLPDDLRQIICQV